jgi:hypothetical protein
MSRSFRRQRHRARRASQVCLHLLRQEQLEHQIAEIGERRFSRGDSRHAHRRLREATAKLGVAGLLNVGLRGHRRSHGCCRTGSGRYRGGADPSAALAAVRMLLEHPVFFERHLTTS